MQFLLCTFYVIFFSTLGLFHVILTNISLFFLFFSFIFCAWTLLRITGSVSRRFIWLTTNSQSDLFSIFWLGHSTKLSAIYKNRILKAIFLHLIWCDFLETKFTHKNATGYILWCHTLIIKTRLVNSNFRFIQPIKNILQAFVRTVYRIYISILSNQTKSVR